MYRKISYNSKQLATNVIVMFAMMICVIYLVIYFLYLWKTLPFFFFDPKRLHSSETK